MNQPHYDMVVVGGGPAGLSAARTAARLGFRTLLLEAQDQPGRQGRSDSVALAPTPGFVTGLRCEDRALYFPALDLHITAGDVLGTLGVQRFLSPGGHEFQVDFAQHDDFPVVVVGRRELLGNLAQQAASAGAELRYGTFVGALLRAGDRIAGVRTSAGEQIQADVVLSAEGAARLLAEEAGLYARPSEPRRYAQILSEDLEAPGALAGIVGQIVTLGARYTSAAQAYGTVMVLAQGRATVHFTVFAGDSPTGRAAPWHYLDEYVQNDPRVRGILAHARSLGRTYTVIEHRAAPRQVVQDGFLATGDAATQSGRMGVLPAIYMGRQAVLVAAEAMDTGEPSAASLVSYQQLCQTLSASLLDVEGQTLYNLTRLADHEIDRFCLALGKWNLGVPTFGHWRAVAWESLTDLVRQLPFLMHDWGLLQQTLQVWNAGPAAGSFGIAMSSLGPYLADVDDCMPAIPKGRI